jgi:phosphoribosylcarboxyaminoimidazole (NCAIR) mutase
MLMPSHSVAIKVTVEKLLAAAKALGLKGYELEEKVKEYKENEAKLINQQGLKAQIEYIFEIGRAHV